MSATVLIVCTGNVCRSPYIERRLQSLIPGSTIRVHSAGTDPLLGASIDTGVAELLLAHHVSPQGHHAREVTPELLDQADVVLTATRHQRSQVVTLHPRALRRTYAFRDFAQLSRAALDSGGFRAAATVTDVRAQMAAMRATVAPLVEAAADVVDPYCQPASVLQQMHQEVESDLPAVAAVLAGPHLLV